VKEDLCVPTNRHTLVELLEFVSFPFCQLYGICQHKFDWAEDLSNLHDVFREVRKLRDVNTKALVADAWFDLV